MDQERFIAMMQLLLVLISAAVALAVQQDALDHAYSAHAYNEPRPRQRRAHTYDFLLNKLPNLSTRDFLRTFRLPRHLVAWLHNRIAGHLRTAQSRRRSSVAHPTLLLLLVALYRLSHLDTTHSIASKFDIGEATVDSAYWTVLAAIDKTLYDEYVDRLWPFSSAARDEAAQFFYTRKGCGIDNVIGSIDGVHIPITAPAEHADDYYNFKKWHSILFLHCVDTRRRHMYIAGGVAGASGDTTILSVCKLWKNIASMIPAPVRAMEDNNMMGAGQAKRPARLCIIASRTRIPTLHTSSRISFSFVYWVMVAYL